MWRDCLFAVSATLLAILTPARAAMMGTDSVAPDSVNIVILGPIVAGDAERFRQTVVTQIRQGRWVSW
jgi:hypothetical protein